MKNTLTRIVSKCIIPTMILGSLYFSIPSSIYAEDKKSKSFYEENKDNPLVNALGKLSDTRFGKGVEGLRRKLIDEWATKQGTGKTIDELQEDAKKALKEFMDTINTEEPKDESIVKYILCGKEEPPTNYEQPAWSPDGKRIAFVSQIETRQVVYVLDLENGRFENLSHKNLAKQKTLVWFNKNIWDEHPSWSPDGKQIVFTAIRGTELHPDDNFDIYIIDANGHNLRNLTNSSVSERDPSWSPDGKRIAFVVKNDVYVIHTDGSGLEKLTNTPGVERHPSWSPDGKKIVFTADRDTRYSEIGNLDICVMNDDGCERKKLANGRQPSWSPGGKRIAFVASNQLYIMDADGSRVEKLTDAPGWVRDPSWSSDGKEIIFTLCYSSGKKGKHTLDKEGLFFVDVPPFKPKKDSTEKRLEDISKPAKKRDAKEGVEERLTNSPTHDNNPSWSPDGKKIVFTSMAGHNNEIYVMNADGSDVTRLTNNDATDSDPSWSPDGKRIAFSSSRDGDYEIYTMDSDGRNKKKLTNNTNYDWDLCWSPDGKKIAFISDKKLNGKWTWEIYTMHADGSNVRRLTKTSADERDPFWSPNGKKIAFRSNRDGNEEIYIINSDGSDVKRLTNNPSRDYAPVWSPDGKKITFYSDRDGNYEIYVMDANGSNVKRLTNNPSSDVCPSWSPDGKKIAFSSDRDGNGKIYVIDFNGEK